MLQISCFMFSAIALLLIAFTNRKCLCIFMLNPEESSGFVTLRWHMGGSDNVKGLTRSP